MPVLFQNSAGKVIQFDDPSAQCTVRDALSISPELNWNTNLAIVTRVTLSHQVNVQFLHTLGSMVYVYVFGDRMGTVSISGLSIFLCECPGDAPDQDDVYTWYKKNRASRRQAPVRVGIGSAVLEGFVTSFTEDVVDPSLNLVQWGVNMAALPDED